MDLIQIARLMAGIGLVILVLAGLLFLFAQVGLPLGKLPGDIVIKRGNISCAVPLVSSLLISAVITILLNIILFLFRK